MVLRVGFQMDPIQCVDPNTDTTFRLAEEAQERGHLLFHYLPNALIFSEGRVFAKGHNIKVGRGNNPVSTFYDEKIIDLGKDLDVLWLRQDPPFDMNYLTTTYLLDFVCKETLVINKPFWVRNFPEKLFVLNYPELMPATIICSSIDAIQRFRDKFGDIILKPLYGNGGIGVFKLSYEDQNLAALFELFQKFSPEPLIVQEFLPEVCEGDKRIILLNGEVLGGINRVPKRGEIRSNLHVGGHAVKTELSREEILICEKLSQSLKDHGQIFVGIDVIGNKLTEINITSPTGLQELEKFEKTNLASKVWELIESKLSK
ncbi:MAG: glutathione synthase [Rhodobacteraceae bacterium]|nr:MAG: glutathione synthase [Paracoccaceae bacterium]